ncbi:thioesterase family protein [Streptomyces sp. 4F14]|uniref:thioesterase family protein n=1 Tax=Streptomyces sp. 4F14 TaxID=3394380 RepID=UPI003A8A0D41
MNAYYEGDDDRGFQPTKHTQGPWDPEFQHFGPPGALLAREIERCAAGTGGEGMSLGRITYDILGPLSLRGPLTVRARVERPGRRVLLVRGELVQDGRPVVSAAAWALRPAPDDVRAVGTRDHPSHALPGSGATAVPPDTWVCGFLDSVEWRFVRGGYGEPGPAVVWLRPRVPLVEGEPMSPLQRTVLSIDSANGISAELDIGTWGFVPPELTVHLLRPPTGEWVCLDAATAVGPGLPGLTTATLYDAQGPIARSHQTLLIHRR